MPSPDSPSPAPPPRFAIASWIVIFVGLLLTFGIYQLAVYFRRPGEWLPGIAEAIISLGVTAVVTFGCSLAALIRRERKRWIALLPFLTSLGAILYYAWKLVMH